MKGLWALLLPVLAAACGDSNVPPPDIAQSREMIRETIKAYHEAGDKGDTDRMATFLAPEVSMFKGQEDFARGRDECVRELVNRVKAYEGQTRNTLLGREVISITGDIAVTTYV
ncbi:MAG TPA: nuclear transport factor 2 family protein, partial [Planctomycetota bacterium]|nr:nuclear transport factor 2 family protein [Planctomycetota bacterium]